jgi:hypothetical protein
MSEQTMSSPAACPSPDEPLQWWQTKGFIAAASLASAIPFLYPSVPPLVDALAHIGRYSVQLGLAGPNANIWYDFNWMLIGNLGIDLLIIPMAAIFGLELAAKIIIMAIPVLLVAGFLLTAREVHGRIPPTALFALPLAYSFPLHFGFINFMLSAALCFLALALWVRLGRQGRLKLRFWLFIPISMILWITHTFGLGMFGIVAFFTDVVRLQQDVKSLRQSVLGSILHCAGLTLPFIPMFLSRPSEDGANMHEWFNWSLKQDWIEMVLKDRWQTFDYASFLLMFAVLILAALWRKTLITTSLGLASLGFFALFFAMPYIVFGSAYADMRLFPFALGCALLAIGVARDIPIRTAATIAFVGLAFFTVRLIGTTYSFLLYDQDYSRSLAALDHLPKNSRLLSFVYKPCDPDWMTHRRDHLPSYALIRRSSFANDQWDLPGSQLIKVKYLEGSGWTNDPSQFTTGTFCRPDWRPLPVAVKTFPRDKFDYLWIIGKPNGVSIDESGLEMVWQSEGDKLYRIAQPASKSIMQ